MNDAAPLSYFSRAWGPASIPTLHLNWVLTGICLAVCFIIAGLLLYAIFRRREGPTNPDENAGLNWVYIGSIISTVILFGITIYMLTVLSGLESPPQPGLTITVTAYDWWWKADYDNADPAKRFTTANEIHIPIGVPVLIKLESADVIHAFWVPELAGKTQTIPGTQNHQWIEADKPGIYRGACTQFCGVQHAHMQFEVIAQSTDDYAKWAEQQSASAKSVIKNTDAYAGQQFFADRCAGCHAVRGSNAAGGHAPDLTHLGSRRLIAAGLMPNTPDNLMDWTMHAQELKPGARMPDIDLAPAEAKQLSAYLATLQ